MERLNSLVQRLASSPAVVVMIVTAGAISLWLTYTAAAEWKRSAADSAVLRAEAGVNLLATALTRDMRALQLLVLPSVPAPDAMTGSTQTLQAIASAFAKYTYPEAFFSWDRNTDVTHNGKHGAAVFYARTDRVPPWLGEVENNPYPVITGQSPDVGSLLLEHVDAQAALGRRFAVFDVGLAGRPYQVVAHIWYKDALRTDRERVFGFLVDLHWAHASYFPEVTAQVSRLADVKGGLSLAVLSRAEADPMKARDLPSARRTIPILFFDPVLIAVNSPADLHLRSAFAQAVVTRDAMLDSAGAGANRVLLIGTASMLVLVVGLIFAQQVAREKTKLAELRSDFVSTITHELKMPVATIGMISETFASGRGITPDSSRKYGRLALHESQRLTRLINNLLTYAGISDVTRAYVFEQVPVHVLVDKALADFSSQLEHGQFEVLRDIPDDIPALRVDPTAMGLLLSNLIDNAIRYSSTDRRLKIAARVHDGVVDLDVTDHGIGIPPDEVAHVTRKFFRGSQGRAGGSGLGLAIVDRIATDHGGKLRIQSALGKGTTVVVSLPVQRPSR